MRLLYEEDVLLKALAEVEKLMNYCTRFSKWKLAASVSVRIPNSMQSTIVHLIPLIPDSSGCAKSNYFTLQAKALLLGFLSTTVCVLPLVS